MATPSTPFEVERALRLCKDLCTRCLDAPASAPARDDFGQQWGHLLDCLSDAFQRLPPMPTGSGVHNWVVFQETRTLLSAAWAWPAHLQGLVPSCWAAINRALLHKRAPNPRAPPAAPDNLDLAPTCTPAPHPAYVQQWTSAVTRKHRRHFAYALADLRQQPSIEPDSTVDLDSLADHILSTFTESPPDSWPEEVAYQHPHPIWEHLDNFSPVESINITSFKAAEEALLRRHTPVFFQEHALPASVHEGWLKRARGRGFTLILSPPDPAAAVAKGGVGILAPVDYRPTEMPARSGAFVKARALGRVMRVVLRTGLHTAITVYNVYGFPGAHHDKGKALRTDAILSAVMEEIEAWGDTCVALLGDLNADLEDLPSIQNFLARGWRDLGSHPAWQGVHGQPAATCFAANGPPQGNRRDFVLTDPQLFGFVHTFEVTPETIFPVHRPLRFLLHNSPQSVPVFHALRPMDPTLHLAHDPSSIEGISFFKHAQVESFAAQDEFLTQAALLKDTSALWRLWSAAMEQAHIACLEPQVLTEHGAAAFSGYGRTRIRQVNLLPPSPSWWGESKLRTCTPPREVTGPAVSHVRPGCFGLTCKN